MEEPSGDVEGYDNTALSRTRRDDSSCRRSALSCVARREKRTALLKRGLVAFFLPEEDRCKSRGDHSTSARGDKKVPNETIVALEAVQKMRARSIE